MTEGNSSKRDLSFEVATDLRTIQRIEQGCASIESVFFSRTADEDMARLGITKQGVLDAIVAHIHDRKLIQTDVMRNHDVAYIFRRCLIETHERYVKLKFDIKFCDEYIVIFSVHEN